ncbi:Fic/DOC family N-terminal domain-containing protein [Flavobacterium soyae]|nr:Fic/DOC family N-terminal domain-containing protein [Flavobacterium soyae]MCD9575471.1 hypothetical protein [Flavobacterium soyae]
MPNPTLFIYTINLQEAQASSAIENIITTQDELFKASIADRKNDNPATKKIMNYLRLKGSKIGYPNLKH